MTNLCPACLSENPTTANSCFGCGYTLKTIPQKDVHHLANQTILINTQSSRRYQIESTLGEGGFGITYKGIDLSQFKNVSIKECWPDKAARLGEGIIWPSSISPENKNEQIRKFIEEGRHIHLCSHPNIVKVYDWFLANNTAYIVMEFIEGQTLYDLVKEKGALNNQQAQKYFREIAHSLTAIHQQNILHRDIKPDNIMLDKLKRAILIDFGNAREFIADKTRSMTQNVSHGYAPLEQYSKQGRRGPSLDIYSLCATFYYVLTATEPPSATDRVHQDTLIPPRQIVSSIDPLIEQILLTGLKLKVEERFATAEDLLQALQGNWTSPTLKKARKLVKEGRLFEATQVYQNCLNEPNALPELAIVQSWQNDPNVEQTAQKAIQANPSDGRSYGVLGTFYCQQKNWLKAVENLEKANQLLTNQSWILGNLAWALIKLDQVDRAEKLLEIALQITPNQPFILGLQAEITVKKQEYKQTIRYARKALLNASTAEQKLKEWLYCNLIRAIDKVTQNLATKDLERACEEFNQQCPNSNLAKGIQGWRLAKNQDWAQALMYFTSEQGDNWIILNKATTEEHLGSRQSAIRTYQIALNNSPNNYQVLYRLGILNGQLKHWQEAKKYLEKSLQLKSDYPEVHHNLGWVLLHIKTDEGNVEYFHPLLDAYKKAIYFYAKEGKIQRANEIKEAFKNIQVFI